MALGCNSDDIAPKSSSVHPQGALVFRKRGRRGDIEKEMLLQGNDQSGRMGLSSFRMKGGGS